MRQLVLSISALLSLTSFSAAATPPPAATRAYCSGHCGSNWSHSENEAKAGYYYHCSAMQVSGGRVPLLIQTGNGATKNAALAALQSSCLSTPFHACYKPSCSILSEPANGFSEIFN